MNLVNHAPHISQEKNKRKRPPVWLRQFNKFLIEYIRTRNVQYFYNAIMSCSKMVKRLIALLLKMDCLYQVVEPAQRWICQQVGSASQSYISELVSALTQSGFLRVTHRGWVPALVINGVVKEPGHWRTNIYKFSAFLDDHKIRAELADILPGCKALEYSLLMVFEKQSLQGFPILLRPSIEFKDDIPAECILIDDCKVPNFDKGETMTLPDRNEMLRSLESLKNTPMSEADIALIGAYPDEVIAYANLCTHRKGELANPFGYFLVCCREYSKKLANGVSQSLRLETQKRYPQKGTSQPSSALTSQQIIENNERIDKLCNQSLKRCQAKNWIKDYRQGKMAKDLLERMLSAIGMLDSCRSQIVQLESNLTSLEI